jgi:hypothetical protein
VTVRFRLADPDAVGANVTNAVPVPPFDAKLRVGGVTANGAAVLRVTSADALPVFVTVIAFAGLV